MKKKKSELRNQRSAVISNSVHSVNSVKNSSPVPASSPGGAVDLQARVKTANRWRDQYNPLRGLTMSTAVSMLESAQIGSFADFQWTNSFIERRDADLLAIIERRSSALLQLDWSVKVMSQQKVVAFDEGLANAQQAFLTAEYNRFENLYEAIEHFALASFRGYSHVQIHDNKFEILDQWNIARDGRYGAWYWNPEARSFVTAANLGEANRLDLLRDRILVRTHPRPIDEIALIKWLRQNLSQKDWDSFIEIYGIPGCVIIMPSNIPSGQESTYKSSAEDVSEGASGALPAGSDVKFSDSPRGVTPFKDHLNYLSEKLVLAGTGGLLTMLSAPGSGTLAGSAHMEAFEMIARAEARKISEVFQKQLDKQLLAAAFPGKPILAYFDISANEENDVGTIVDHALKLSQAGYKMDSAQLAEKTGYTLTEAPAPTVPQQAPAIPNRRIQNSVHSVNSVKNSAPSALLSSAIPQIAEALSNDLQPVRERLAIIMQVEDPELRNSALTKLQTDLPAILKKQATAPECARIIEDTLSAAMANGMQKNAARPAAPAKGAA